MGVIKIQFWICFFVSWLCYRLLRPFEKMGVLSDTGYIQNILGWHRIWRAGDRYYQSFKILPYIPNCDKNSKILYVGVQGNMGFNIKTLTYLYPNTTFLDTDVHAQRYVQNYRFVAGSFENLASVFGDEKFDCIVISGVYYFYPHLADDFLDTTAPIIAHQLNDNGIFITGIYQPSYLQNYKQCMDSPMVQKYFQHALLRDKSIHKAYRRLFRKTWDTYHFEIMVKSTRRV